MGSGLMSRMATVLGIGKTDVVAVVRVDGPIGDEFGQRGVSAEGMESVLRRAFDSDNLRAVAVVINSPGGSPAQSEYIAERIRQLSAEKGVKVFAFCEDMAASGGYWIACAADEIFAARTSLVGSIGVVSSGFGLQDLMSRLGIERRLYTAGKNKARMDMFSPESDEDIAWVSGLQGRLHEEFKAWVSQRRGTRLRGSGDVLYSGDIWIGTQAVELGIIDGIGVVRSVIAERYPDAEIVPIDAPKPLLARLAGGQVSVASLTRSVVTGAVQAVETLPATRFR